MIFRFHYHSQKVGGSLGHCAYFSKYDEKGRRAAADFFAKHRELSDYQNYRCNSCATRKRNIL